MLAQSRRTFLLFLLFSFAASLASIREVAFLAAALDMRSASMVTATRIGSHANRYTLYGSHQSCTFLNTITCRPTAVRSRRYSGSSSLVMMPEGPEVRTLVNQLQAGVGKRLVDWKFLSGRYIRHGKPAGWDAFRATMTPFSENRDSDDDTKDCILEWNCKGKFIYMLLDDGDKAPPASPGATDFARSIWITLGMTGRFVSQAVHDQMPKRDQEHARWYLEVAPPTNATIHTNTDDEESSSSHRTRIYYYDMRNFGTLKFSLSRQDLADKLQSLGPDILQTDTTTPQTFVQLVESARPSSNVCRFLMDQSRIAGIGNYILAEGLYRAKIDPFATLGDLTVEQQKRLFRELQKVAVESFQSQGMTRAEGGQYRTMDDRPGQFTFALQCYGRSVAANGEAVFKEVNGPHGRTIWYTREQLFRPRFTVGESEQHTFAPNPRDVPSLEADKSTGDPKTMVDPVLSLTSYLSDPSWKNALSSAFESDWFEELAMFVAVERASHQIYPPAHQVFEALNLSPLDDVKVVIVGQGKFCFIFRGCCAPMSDLTRFLDPYHGPGQGHGLAFSVQRDIKPPPSLVNIFKEAHADVEIPYPPPHGNLEQWATQGVLLLNSVLTVRRGMANSHSRHGWETLTDTIVEILNERKEGLVFLLWGQPAQRKASTVDESKHFVIRTSHPSPLGATKTNSPFLGSRCFSKANQFLEQAGQRAIDWKVI